MDVKANIYFVLVRPLYLGNIGAAARALKNFGLANLRLVEPPRNYKDAEARKMSVGAFDVLKNAEVFACLADALKDISLTIGTTSGQQRGSPPRPIENLWAEIGESASNNRIALLFGDERNGLTNQDLERCHYLSTIATDAKFPALNMAQAVAICAYELSRLVPGPAAGDTIYPAGAEDDELFFQIGDLLDTLNFSRTFNRQTVLGELRQLYQRARPSKREADLLKGVLHAFNREFTSR